MNLRKLSFTADERRAVSIADFCHVVNMTHQHRERIRRAQDPLLCLLFQNFEAYNDRLMNCRRFISLKYHELFTIECGAACLTPSPHNLKCKDIDQFRGHNRP
jgi:hypothetical protein